jgi:hypothetical protein
MTTCELTISAAKSLPLEEQERELLESELQAMTEALRGDRRRRYEALASSVRKGVIPGEDVQTLSELLELILASGRARHVHRADGERQLAALYDRTPRGEARKAEEARTNQALRALTDQAISSIRVASSVTGRHTVTIATPEMQLTLVADHNGVRVDKVGI